MEVVRDLFQDQIISQKMDYFRKVKVLDWLFTADLRVPETEEELKDLVNKALTSGNPVSCDIETEGLSFKSDALVGVSFGFMEGHVITSFYVPILSYVEKIQIPKERALAILKPLIETPLIYFNGKFDIKWFKNLGMEPKILADVSIMRFCVDTGLDDALFNKTKSMSLKETYYSIFGEHALDLEEVLGKGVYNFGFCPKEGLKFYGAADSYITLKLYFYYKERISPDSFIFKLENMILPIVADMEYEGIRIDMDVLKEAKIKILEEQKEYEELIYKLSGEKFNLNSSEQLGSILYGKLGLPPDKITPGGEKSTDKASLEKTLDTITKNTDVDKSENFKIGQQLLDTLFKYKDNHKLVTSFINPLMVQVASDGKAHPVFYTYGAISGRFSASDPPIQTLPKSESGNKAILRKAFTCDPDTYLLSADYSQMELRIMASMSREPNLKDAFVTGVDVHKRTASIMNNIKVEDVTKEQRYHAKTINFSLLYGAGAYNLSQQLKIPMDDAEQLRKLYFSKLPLVKRWIEEKKVEMHKTGMSLTHWRRVRLVPDAKITINWNDKSDEAKRNNKMAGEALRAGLNHIVQGTGADITKLAMCRLERRFKGKDVKMLVQVHDQIIFKIDINTKPEEIIPIIKEAMELKVEGFVPLTVDIQVGWNWGDLVDWESGMILDQIPIKNKITISGDVVAKGEELKVLFNEFKGDNEVFLDVDGSLIRPEMVDDETGEVLETKVLATKELIKKIEDLGLKVN